MRGTDSWQCLCAQWVPVPLAWMGEVCHQVPGQRGAMWVQATISPATAGIEPPFRLYSPPPAPHPFKNSLASLFVHSPQKKAKL